MSSPADAVQRTPPAAAPPSEDPRLRAVAIDLDGTLLNSGHVVGDRDRAAIEMVKRAGVLPVLASSRAPAAVRPVALALGLVSPVPVVAAQGALVGRFSDGGEFIVDYETRLPIDAARAVATLALAAGVAVNWYAGDVWTASGTDAGVEKEARIVGHRPQLADVLGLEEAPHKLMLIAAPGPLAAIVAALPPAAQAHRSSPGYLEITAAGVDKGSAFSRLCRAQGLDERHQAAIGDGPNDLSLFARVGTSIAMGNASPLVRAAATMVTADHDHDGVADALDNLFSGVANTLPAQTGVPKA